jgi:hypothetical protein
VRLTALDGSEIDINPAEIISLRDTSADRDTFHGDAKCAIKTVDGATLGVRESCGEVRAKLAKLGWW